MGTRVCVGGRHVSFARAVRCVRADRASLRTASSLLRHASPRQTARLAGSGGWDEMIAESCALVPSLMIGARSRTGDRGVGLSAERRVGPEARPPSRTHLTDRAKRTAPPPNARRPHFPKWQNSAWPRRTPARVLRFEEGRRGEKATPSRDARGRGAHRRGLGCARRGRVRWGRSIAADARGTRSPRGSLRALAPRRLPLRSPGHR